MLKKLNKTTLIFMVGLFLLASNSLFSQSDGWKLAKEKDGVKVYTRVAENSKLKEFKTVADVNAAPEDLVQVLLNADEYPSWMANIKKSELVEQPTEDVFFAYSELSVPWPFDNRDNVIKSTITSDTKTGSYRVDMTMVPDYLPEKKGVVRIVEGGGYWAFTPNGDGTTNVYHEFFADPAGRVPAWLVNMFIVDGPYKTIMELREMVEEQTESEARLQMR
jgi:hypothetical protein